MITAADRRRRTGRLTAAPRCLPAALPPSPHPAGEPTTDSGPVLDPPQGLPGSGQVRGFHGSYQGHGQTAGPEGGGQRASRLHPQVLGRGDQGHARPAERAEENVEGVRRGRPGGGRRARRPRPGAAPGHQRHPRLLGQELGRPAGCGIHRSHEARDAAQRGGHRPQGARRPARLGQQRDLEAGAAFQGGVAVQAGGGQAGGQVRAGAGEDGVAGPGAQHPHCEAGGEDGGRQEQQQQQQQEPEPRRSGPGQGPGDTGQGRSPPRGGAEPGVRKPTRKEGARSHRRLLGAEAGPGEWTRPPELS